MPIHKTRNAAVMVLLEEHSNTIVLTERSQHLRHHADEICFPGGTIENQDGTLLDTALRELEEELNITPERVHAIQPLQTEFTLTGFLIQPWFASIKTLPPFSRQQEEVQRVIQVPFSDVCQRKNYKDIFFENKNKRIKTVAFVRENDVIWGATARIMMQLIKWRVKPRHF